MSMFKRAVKAESKLRLAIAGPSGSGKTYTSLAIATALAAGKPVALVDTEHGSASKYAGLFDFDVAEMHPPFHPDKFIAAVREAQAAGYAVIILDSISHAWSGTGGVLDLVDEAAKRSKSGNTYTAWKEGTPVQNRMIDAIVQSGIHVIATMRSKTEYILADTGNGKQAPRKVGMAPVQRDQFEYEFDVVFDMDIENNAIVSKTRCPALTGRVFARPGADVAGILRDWLSDGQPAPQPPSLPQPTHRSQPEQAALPPEVEFMDAPPAEDEQADEARPGQVTKPQLNTIHALGTALYGSKAMWDAKRHAIVRVMSGKRTESSGELWQAEATQLVAELEKRVIAEAKRIAKPLVDAGVMASIDEIDQASGVELAQSLTNLRKVVEQGKVAA